MICSILLEEVERMAGGLLLCYGVSGLDVAIPDSCFFLEFKAVCCLSLVVVLSWVGLYEFPYYPCILLSSLYD